LGDPQKRLMKAATVPAAPRKVRRLSLLEQGFLINSPLVLLNGADH
jgi:hypothetical protein